MSKRERVKVEEAPERTRLPTARWLGTSCRRQTANTSNVKRGGEKEKEARGRAGLGCKHAGDTLSRARPPPSPAPYPIHILTYAWQAQAQGHLFMALPPGLQPTSPAPAHSCVTSRRRPTYGLTAAQAGANKHTMLGHFLTGHWARAAPCALSHRPAIAAAVSRHHRCSGHLPGTRDDSRGKGGGRCCLAVPLPPTHSHSPTVVPFATRCRRGVAYFK
eukprot:scaffold32195_cov122-Isochrysis_galbana.AAC.2